MRTISVLIASAMLASMSSCIIINRSKGIVPSEEKVSFNIAANNVTAISSAASIAVIYTQAETTSVAVECPENLKDLLDITVNDGELDATFKTGTTINGNSNVTVRVSSPALTGIEASSSSRVSIDSGLTQTGSLEIEASSAAVVEGRNINVSSLEIEASSSATVALADLRANSVDVDASSASTVVLTGNGEEAQYEASSAARISAENYDVSRLSRAKASSAAHITYSAETTGSIKEDSAGSVSKP